MHIEDLIDELNAVFALPAHEIKAHVADLELYIEHDKRIYALVEARVRARIKRGIAKRMVTREENAILRDYPRTISKLKLMVRAIREGMAYRSIA
jgi:hypothetical protein